ILPGRVTQTHAHRARFSYCSGCPKLRTETFSGSDIVGAVVRLCAMNLYLHGIGGETCPIAERDALASDPGERFDIVVTNPPFGKKSSYSIVGEDGDIDREVEHYERDDFKVTTSNKQLNFLQHIMTILKTTGRAAVVLPDNVLFEGGAGEKLRKRLLVSVHKVLESSESFVIQGRRL
ncbi:MAG: N-6 DNA methylase, partial [Rhodomicrobium sp.]